MNTPSEHAIRAAEMIQAQWLNSELMEDAEIIDAYAIAPAVAERDRRIAELVATLLAVKTWYERDGSVGGCSELMEAVDKAIAKAASEKGAI